MAAILKDEPPAIADTGIQVPVELVRVIDRCLAKNPAQRFHSAHDVAFALGGILSGVSEKPAAVAGPRGMRFRLPLAIATAVVILAAAGLFYWRSHDDGSDAIAGQRKAAELFGSGVSWPLTEIACDYSSRTRTRKHTGRSRIF